VKYVPLTAYCGVDVEAGAINGVRWGRLIYICFSGWILAAQSGIAQTNRDALRVVLSEPEKAWIAKHPVVYWGVDPQWPPFSSFDKQGQITGINAELVRLLVKRTGLNLQFRRTENWSETLHKASTGEIDVVVGIARTEARERLLKLAFTEVFCKFPTAIVTRKDTPFLMLVSELKSKRIALPRDYATTEMLQRLYPEVHLTLTESEEQSMLLVARGRADATALNLASAGYIVHMRGLANVKIAGFTEIDFFLGLAVRKSEPELHSILEKGLDTINPREKEAIYANYIHPDTRREIDWKTWRWRAIYALLAGAAGVAGLLFWNRKMAKEIQRRKAAESALVQARDKIEAHARELASRAHEMELLNKNLAYANKDLESFSYSVSHDLKSPLRRVKGFADLLEKDAGGRLDSAERGYLEVIKNESERMNNLIEGLLDFARIGHREIRSEAVDMERLMNGVIAGAKLENPGREISWEVHPLPTIDCDRELMRQVAENLIGNAVKFTRGRTPARIEIGVLPKNDGNEEVVFYVKDNGAGFEMSDAGKLFAAFQRLHSEKEFEGTGIGLANVQRIIQKHGGRVWAEGEVDKGATFYFSLPRCKRHEKSLAE
jgi:signal transduction histidine kinase